MAALAACGAETLSPEQRLRTSVAAFSDAVEGGALQQAAEFLQPDYSDRWHPDKAAAMRSLFAYLRRHRNLHLFHLTKDVQLAPAGEHASAVVYVAMTGVPVESVQALITLKADLYRFDLEFVSVEGEWRVLHAEWRRADLRVL